MKKAKKNKITSNLIKNFIRIIIIIAILSFIASSTFLSNFYISQQYNNLKSTAENIYDSLKTGTSYDNFEVNAAIIKNNKIIPLTKGRHMSFNFIRQINLSNTSGQVINQFGKIMMYYILKTDMGNIMVFKSYENVSQYKKIIYITLFVVFAIIILINIPLILYTGKKLTKPILKLEKASREIAMGNFKADLTVNTRDEIYDLSQSLTNMAEKLERKSSLQREFISNVSHDFKTPLSIIRNFSEAINDSLIDKSKYIEYSQSIIEEVDRLNKMVIDILNLSKLQEGNIKINSISFSIKDLLEDCKNKFYFVSKENNISINLETIDAEVKGDYDLLSRVIYNFLDNAIKFSEKNSTVELSSMYVNGNIRVRVKNYGKGIEENVLENIWDRYYKSNKSGGMGLGLPISKEILKIHGFEYGIINKKNEYTEFYFII